MRIDNILSLIKKRYTGQAGTKLRTPNYELNSPKPKSGLNY